jgi:hypothetical protein
MGDQPTTEATRRWHIYTLSDPRTGEVRYVGKTQKADPKKRLNSHISDAVMGKDQTRCGRWKRSLLADGVRPVLTVIESGTGDGWIEAEQRWVAHWRAIAGDRLTNLTDGGEGMAGYVIAPETRVKMSAAKMGKKRAPEVLARMSEWLRGRRVTPETRAKIAAAHGGMKHSDEAKAKQRAAKLGQKRGPMPDEVRAKIAASNTGKKPSQEAIAKQRGEAGRQATQARTPGEGHRGHSRTVRSATGGR